jgi:hypothetical protein
MFQLSFEKGVPATPANDYKLTLDSGNDLKLLYGQLNGLGGDFYGTYGPICEGNDFEEQKRRNDGKRARDVNMAQLVLQPYFGLC